MFVSINYEGIEYQTPYTSIAELLEDCDENGGKVQTSCGKVVSIHDIDKIRARNEKPLEDL